MTFCDLLVVPLTRGISISLIQPSVSPSQREKQDTTNTKFTSKKALACIDWQVDGMAEKKTGWSVQKDQTLLGRWPCGHMMTSSPG